MTKKIAILGLFALLVVIIVGISLAVYFNTKKSSEEPSEKKPELTFDIDAKKTINPQEEDNDTQEGYAIEYAGGEFIDLTLSWNNGQGFDGVVNKLIFTRYVGDTKIQDDKISEKAGEIADNGSGSVTFSGTDVSDGVDTKGVNVIKAYYNEVSADNELASVELEITEADFDQVMTGEFSSIVVPVRIPKDSFKLTRTVKKTYYQLSLDAVDQSIKYVSAFTNKKVNGYWYTVKQDGDIFKFIREDGKEVQLGKEKNSEFKIQTYKGGGKILIHAGDCSKASSAALCNKAKGKIYVNEGQDGAYFSVDEMTSDRWTKAQFTIINKMTIAWPQGKFSTDGNSGAPCERENAKYCLEELMESTMSNNFKATANTAAGNACSIKYNCAPDIWF